MQVIDELPKEEWIDERAQSLFADRCAPFRDEESAIDGLIGGPELLRDEDAVAFWKACQQDDKAAVGKIVMNMVRDYWRRASRERAAADYDMALKHFCLECGKGCALCECGVPS